MCTNFGASENKTVQQLKDIYEKINNKDELTKNPIEAERVYNELQETQLKML